jgi:diamine N-acetyltransferase
VVALVYSEDVCRIRHFAIDVHRQRRGFGGAAMAALIEHVKATRPSCRSMVVSFHPDNEPARRLYTGVGFVVTGVQQNGEPVCSFALRDVLDPGFWPR